MKLNCEIQRDHMYCGKIRIKLGMVVSIAEVLTNIGDGESNNSARYCVVSSIAFRRHAEVSDPHMII